MKIQTRFYILIKEVHLLKPMRVLQAPNDVDSVGFTQWSFLSSTHWTSSMDICKRIGNNFSKLRHEKGLTQKQIATQSGINRSYISQLENGRINPKISTISKLAKALDVCHTQFFHEN